MGFIGFGVCTGYLRFRDRDWLQVWTATWLRAQGLVPASDPKAAEGPYLKPEV